MSLINLSIVSMLPSRSPNWKSCNIFNICKIYLLYVDDLINGAININFPSTEEGRYFARLSNFTPSIGEVDFVMERDIWRGIKAIRKESGRFRFPFSPFCFTLLNRKRVVRSEESSWGVEKWEDECQRLGGENKNRLFISSLFNLSLDR